MRERLRSDLRIQRNLVLSSMESRKFKLIKGTENAFGVVILMFRKNVDLVTG